MLEAQILNMVSMDELFLLPQSFHNTDTVMVIYSIKHLPTETEKELIESYVFWKERPAYIYKEQSGFTHSDTTYHLQLWGSFASFNHPYFNKIPIKSTKKGFEFKTLKYESPNDAFFYIHPSAKLMYTCFNSKTAYQQMAISGMGAYPLTIMHNNEFVWNGFSPDSLGYETINHLDSLRAAYFEYKPLNGLELYVAKTLNYDSVFTEAEE